MRPAERRPAKAASSPKSGGSASSAADNLSERLTRIEDDLRRLTDMFRRRLLNDRERLHGITVLQQQLDQARDAAEGRLLRPLLYDLVLVIDRAEREGAGERNELAASIRQELAMILEKYDVHRIDAAGAHFDPATQTAVGSVATRDPSLVGTVAEVVRPGYRLGGGVLRHEEVRVYVAAEAGSPAAG